MKNIFKNIDIVRFEDHFDSDEKCFAFLADEKWQDGFICRKCSHTNYCKGKKPYSRRCTRCKSEESATAHTIFHKCKFPIVEAFKITYLVCHTPDISSYKIADRVNIRQMTCWKFKKKIMECIDSRGDINLLEKEQLKENLLS